jgi:hypothetical protein
MRCRDFTLVEYARGRIANGDGQPGGYAQDGLSTTLAGSRPAGRLHYAESRPETYNLDLMIPLKDIDKNRSDLEGIGFTTIAGHQGGRIRLRKRVAGVKMGAGRSFLCRPTSVSLILRRQPWMRW